MFYIYEKSSTYIIGKPDRNGGNESRQSPRTHRRTRAEPRRVGRAGRASARTQHHEARGGLAPWRSGACSAGLPAASWARPWVAVIESVTFSGPLTGANGSSSYPGASGSSRAGGQRALRHGPEPRGQRPDRVHVRYGLPARGGVRPPKQ